LGARRAAADAGRFGISRRRGIGAALAAAVCLLPAVTGAGAAPAPPRPPVRNLILVSIDTLRADRVGVYGYSRNTTPALDALAGTGAVFTRAISQASWTLPSHMSILTGLYPMAHGAISYDRKLPEEVPTLAEVLEHRGFHTAAFVEGGYLNERFGYAQGFESWTPYYEGFPGMMGEARRFVERQPEGSRYFLFLHTYEVHCPYYPSAPYRKMFTDAGAEPPLDARGLCGKKDFLNHPPSPKQLEYLSSMYDGSIREADDELGKFFAFLRERGAMANTAVVVLADHGESFMGHGAVGHIGEMHWGVLNVPLVVAAPGIPPSKVSTPVGLVDVMPTVLDLLDVKGPPVQGRSLVPLMTGRRIEPEAVPIFSSHGSGPEIRSVVDGDLHLIVRAAEAGQTPAEREVELYDFAKDPAEKVDLEETRAQEAVALLRLLDAHYSEMRKAREEYARDPTQEELEKLRSLGYVQ